MKVIHEIQNYFKEFIPQNPRGVYRGNWGLDGVKKLAKFLGAPQEKYQVVHIAGTSGKGSTAYLTATALSSQNIKVGLHVSPFILDFREAFTINGKFLAENKLKEYFIEFKNKVAKFKLENPDNFTYYELLACFSYFVFYKEKVAVAVVEVGLGGLYDCTNIVKNPTKISVISKIGYDHQEILGKTISQLTTQKCGIIQPKNTVISIKQDYLQATKIIIKTASLQGSKLITVNKAADFQLKTQPNRFYYAGQRIQQNFELSLLGSFQLENACLALASFEQATLNLKIEKLNLPNLSKAFINLKIPARMDLKNFQNKQILLDGAHNFQKMSELIQNLKKLFPKNKYTFLVSFLQGKDYKKMLGLICPVAEKLVYSDFTVTTQALYKKSVNFTDCQKIFKKLNFKNYTYQPDLEEAFEKTLSKKTKEELVVATGSLYFLSKLYEVLEVSSAAKN